MGKTLDCKFGLGCKRKATCIFKHPDEVPTSSFVHSPSVPKTISSSSSLDVSSSSSSQSPEQIAQLSEDYKKRAEDAIRDHQAKIFAVEESIADLLKRRSGTMSKKKFKQENEALEIRREELKIVHDIFTSFYRTIDWKKVSCGFLNGRERDLRRFKMALPAYSLLPKLNELLRNHKRFVVIGATGSGKSTQLPQMLAESRVLTDLKINKKMSVICTQPRPIAAKALYERVKQEFTVSQIDKDSVGLFLHDMKQFNASRVRLSFTTNSFLLNHLNKDPDLREFSCVMLDEAHERTVDGDILLAFLKELTKKRDDFYLIVSSATIEKSLFQNYLECSDDSVLTIGGRLFPVEKIFSPKATAEHYLDSKVYRPLAINKLKELINSPEQRFFSGDILVFMPSQEDCEKVKEDILKSKGLNIDVISLHGNSPEEDRDKALARTEPGKRKIIISTNIAETSLTIDGIVHVIESGLAKEVRYDSKKNMDILELRPITKSSAKQRAGRGGRTQPGICHFLYPKEFYELMEEYPIPEIKRKHLGKTILILLNRKVTDIFSFDYVERPKQDAFEEAISLLNSIQALDHQGGITKLGNILAQLPTDPMVSKVVIEAAKIGLKEAGAQIGAMIMCGGKLFHFRKDDQELSAKVEEARRKFGEKGGDLINLISILRTFQSFGSKEEKKEWVNQNYLNHFSLNSANKEYHRILASLKPFENILELPIMSECGQIEALSEPQKNRLRKCICSGFFQNVISIQPDMKNYFIFRLNLLATMNIFKSFPSTTSSPPKWAIYIELFSSSKGKTSILMVSDIEREWIDELAPDFSRKINFQVKSDLPSETFDLCDRVIGMIIGPCGSRRETLQRDLCCSIFAKNGKLTVTAERANIGLAATTIRQLIDFFTSQVKNEVEVRQILNARCVVGRKGEVQNILNPNEYIKVKIGGIEGEITEIKATQYLEEFIGVKNCVCKVAIFKDYQSDQNDVPLSCMIVTFTRPVYAKKVATELLATQSNFPKSRNAKGFQEDARWKKVVETKESHSVAASWKNGQENDDQNARLLFGRFGTFSDLFFFKQENTCLARINYEKEASAIKAVAALHGKKGLLGSGILKVRIEMQRNICIPHKDFLKFLEKQVEETIAALKAEFPSVKVKIPKMKDRIIAMAAVVPPNTTTDICREIDRFVESFQERILYQKTANQLTKLSSPFLRDVMKKTNTFVHLLPRQRLVSVFGSQDNVVQGLEMIMEFQRENQRPNHLERSQIKIYNSVPKPCFEQFKQAIEKYNPNEAKFSFVGYSCKVEAPSRILNEINNLLADLNPDLSDKACVICLSATHGIHSGKMLTCHHFICDGCFSDQLKSTDEYCCGGCREEMSFSEIFYSKNLADLETISVVEKKILDRYINANLDRFTYCQSCNEGICRKQENGGYKCLNLSCGVSVCGECKKKIFDGHVCRSDIDMLEQIAKEDPKRFRICPNCQKLQERISGCNAVVCQYCRTNFCWRCLRDFGSVDAHKHYNSSEDQCYGKCFE